MENRPVKGATCGRPAHRPANDARAVERGLTRIMLICAGWDRMAPIRSEAASLYVREFPARTGIA
jgi:hypothetical protein